jgi:hypothetical protein
VPLWFPVLLQNNPVPAVTLNLRGVGNMAEELQNKFQRAADPMNGLGWESNLYRDGIFFVVGATNLWVAQGRARDPERHENLQITGPSRQYLIGRLSESVKGFRLVQRGHTAAELVREELQKAKGEIEERKSAAAEQEKSKKPKLQIFGTDADSAEAQQIAQREAAAFVQAHAFDQSFLWSPHNQRNLQRRVTELWERGEIKNPTAEVYEQCWQWLKREGYIEEPTRKRGAPAAKIYHPQPVEPKPTREQAAAAQRAAALEERRRLHQIPFEELQRLYESQKGRTRKAAFAVNR